MGGRELACNKRAGKLSVWPAHSCAKCWSMSNSSRSNSANRLSPGEGDADPDGDRERQSSWAALTPDEETANKWCTRDRRKATAVHGNLHDEERLWLSWAARYARAGGRRRDGPGIEDQAAT